MKKIYFLFTLIIFGIPIWGFSQVNIDTTIITSSNIICYMANSPQYGRLMPPVKPLYVTFISSPEMDWSAQLPRDKITQMRGYINTFSLLDTELSDIDTYLCYVSQLAISEPIKSPEYLEATYPTLEEISDNLNYRNQEATLVLKLLTDLSGWAEKKNNN